MRTFWFLSVLAGGTVAGIWFLITAGLAGHGIDVTLSRFAAAVLGFGALAAIATEEAAQAVRVRVQQGRLLRARRTLAEAGQISMPPAGHGALALPPSEGEALEVGGAPRK